MKKKVKRGFSNRKGAKRFLSAALTLTVLLTGSLAMKPETGMGQVQAAAAKATGYTWEEQGNMAVTTDASVAAGLPKSETDPATYIKWETASTDESTAINEPTNAVFLNGRLYWSAKGYLYELDEKTGEVLHKVALSHNVWYNYFLTTGGGMLLIQEGLYVEAFDEELNSLWVSEALETENTSQIQGLVQLNYVDGYIYGGTVGVGGKTGSVFCLRAAAEGADEAGTIKWKNQSELISCGANKNYTGYYWSAGVVVGDYFVYAGEGGRVTSADRLTGEIAADGAHVLDLSPDTTYAKSVRSSLVYADGYLYMTSTDGYLYKIAFDAATGALGEKQKILIGPNQSTTLFGSICTATPVIYENRLYVGDAYGIGVFDISGSNLTKSYYMASDRGTMRDIRLVVDEKNNCVYGFTEYYQTPGSLVLFKDTPGQTSGQLRDFASLTNMACSQNAASMPIFGPDGTIYFSNDAGVLMAVGTNQAYLSELTVNGTLDQSFQSGYLHYDLAVAPGTSAATFSMTVPEEAEVTVNDTPVTVSDGKAQASVSVKDKQAVLKITNGDAVRTYTISLREKATDASLNRTDTKLNQSNSYAETALPTEWITTQVAGVFDVSSTYKRLWLETTNPKATTNVYALTGFGSRTEVNTKDNEILTQKVLNGKTYIPLYFADNFSYMALRVHVTAEDGVMVQNYYYVISQDTKADFLSTSAYSDLVKTIAKTDQTAFASLNKAFQNGKITLSKSAYTYSGAACLPTITMKNSAGVTLTQNTDYTVTYKNNKNAGTASVVLTGKGSYAAAGTKTVHFSIGKRDLSKLTFSKVTAKVYTGKSQTPSVTVKNGKTTLKKNTDYTIAYTANKAVGTAKITITGKGSYSGKKVISFAINPKSTKITKVTAGKKQLTIKWNKVSGVTGYKIYRSTSKKSGYKCVATIKGSAKTSYTNKKLTSKKTYYYKVVCYKTVSKKTYSSSYSAYKAGKAK